jgi:hypothetical protein
MPSQQRRPSEGKKAQAAPKPVAEVGTAGHAISLVATHQAWTLNIFGMYNNISYHWQSIINLHFCLLGDTVVALEP